MSFHKLLNQTAQFDVTQGINQQKALHFQTASNYAAQVYRVFYLNKETICVQTQYLYTAAVSTDNNTVSNIVDVVPSKPTHDILYFTNFNC
jgi:hypothetical protein